MATLVNGTMPGPVLRWREGDTVTLRVTNRLNTPTSNELRTGNGTTTYRWDAEAWFGDNLNRAWLRSEGNLNTHTGTFEEAEVQALYSRAITRHFDLQTGLRYDVEPSPSRGWFTVGIEEMAVLEAAVAPE
jgi:uncharacterized protein involved in copper resistance